MQEIEGERKGRKYRDYRDEIMQGGNCARFKELFFFSGQFHT